ncbi:hypothetical protein HK105_203412 [Polyrhizophydium stewartii]|uniref:Mitochondrial genome maintenance protein MGM101 n=1 Tax=Polyrhizophydium stewartii TaxID=2732419 RepID=A0ABR4NBS9_9FUNG|nr:hypothetical protein HK105_002358 [Polyrhizophydium stewartii]
MTGHAAMLAFRGAAALRLVRPAAALRAVTSSARRLATESGSTPAAGAESQNSMPRRAAAKPTESADASAFPSAVSFENELAGSESAPQGVRAFRDESPVAEDLTRSFRGVSAEPFPEQVARVLAEPINEDDIEVKPDGMLYLPEIKYRRLLNRAFGPGGWGLVPRGPHTVNNKNISREYALFALGRFVSQARGEQDFFGDDSLPTASEGCKSNALMRCCKDLGLAWELWDPVFIRKFKNEHAVMVSASHALTGAKKYLWRRKDRTLDYPYKEEASAAKSSSFRR